MNKINISYQQFTYQVSKIIFCKENKNLFLLEDFQYFIVNCEQQDIETYFKPLCEMKSKSRDLLESKNCLGLSKKQKISDERQDLLLHLYQKEIWKNSNQALRTENLRNFYLYLGYLKKNATFQPMFEENMERFLTIDFPFVEIIDACFKLKVVPSSKIMDVLYQKNNFENLIKNSNLEPIAYLLGYTIKKKVQTPDQIQEVTFHHHIDVNEHVIKKIMIDQQYELISQMQAKVSNKNMYLYEHVLHTVMHLFRKDTGQLSKDNNMFFNQLSEKILDNPFLNSENKIEFFKVMKNHQVLFMHHDLLMEKAIYMNDKNLIEFFMSDVKKKQDKNEKSKLINLLTKFYTGEPADFVKNITHHASSEDMQFIIDNLPTDNLYQDKIYQYKDVLQKINDYLSIVEKEQSQDFRKNVVKI